MARSCQATAQRLKILAPFDGIAGIRGVNVGDYLKDGADIVNIEDLDAVYVDFRLPERLQGKVRPGQTAQVTFDALPGARYAAVVQASANALLPGHPPDVERLVATLQAATDRTLGRRGARLLIGPVMVV